MSDDHEEGGGGAPQIPVTWKAGNKAVHQTAAPVVRPNARELKVFGNQRSRTCGECQHFRHRAFQEAKRNFVRELIHDYGWKIWNLGANPDDMGRCAQDESVAVGPHSLGCEQFKVK